MAAAQGLARRPPDPAGDVEMRALLRLGLDLGAVGRFVRRRYWQSALETGQDSRRF
jgi:hypothetical protein